MLLYCHRCTTIKSLCVLYTEVHIDTRQPIYSIHDSLRRLVALLNSVYATATAYEYTGHLSAFATEF